MKMIISKRDRLRMRLRESDMVEATRAWIENQVRLKALSTIQG